jgi:hypothetical protein
MNGGTIQKKDNMDKFNFFNRRALGFPITDILEGCNALITTKAELAEQLTVSVNNIKNLSFNTDSTITWHSVNDYSINRSFSFSDRPNTDQRQNDLAAAVTRFESYKMIGANSFLFSGSNIKVLKLFNRTSIGVECLRDLNKIEVFEMPKLISFGNASLSDLGKSNGSKTVTLDFPLLQNFGDISGNFNIINNYGTNVNFTGRVWNWNKQVTLPFDTSIISSLGGSNNFRNCNNIQGSLNFTNPGVTSIGAYSFWKSHGITELIFPNIIVLDPGQVLFREMNAIQLISLRKCTTLIGSSVFQLLPTNREAEVNIAMLDYEGSGSVNSRVQYLLDIGWTVRFYDDNDNLVTTL